MVSDLSSEIEAGRQYNTHAYMIPLIWNPRRNQTYLCWWKLENGCFWSGELTKMRHERICYHDRHFLLLVLGGNCMDV